MCEGESGLVGGFRLFSGSETFEDRVAAPKVACLAGQIEWRKGWLDGLSAHWVRYRGGTNGGVQGTSISTVSKMLFPGVQTPRGLFFVLAAEAL